MTTTETTTQTIVDTYLAAFNEADRAARVALLEQAFTADAHYVDPLADVHGVDGIADMIEGLRGQFPGATLERTGDIDAHHDVLRFPWAAIGTDGVAIVAGIDVCVLADDGRVQALAGFFG
jgi:limonene-1,2-epoxide hydrolase